MSFDRFDICLAYYWYAHYGYERYEEQCSILRRLAAIGFKPSHGNECSDAYYEDENLGARMVYEAKWGEL